MKIGNFGKTIRFHNASQILGNISDLTGVPVVEIDQFVDSLENFERGERPNETYWEAFIDRFKVSPKIEATVLFHGTRCLGTMDFNQGLLSNDVALALIWKQLWEMFEGDIRAENVREFRSEFEGSALSKSYFARIRDQRQNGPWGKLVREDWFLDNNQSNHYLDRAPEIVTLILKSCGNGHFEEIYRRKTRPCIVHFIAKSIKSPTDIGYGISFLRDKKFCRDWSESSRAYGLYSLEGNSVPFEDILDVEFI